MSPLNRSTTANDPARFETSLVANGQLVAKLTGRWVLDVTVPTFNDVFRTLFRDGVIGKVTYDTSGLVDWDSAVLAFLVQMSQTLRDHGVSEDLTGLPRGLQRLIALAQAVPERAGARTEAKREPFIARVGTVGLAIWDAFVEYLWFIGQCGIAFWHLVCAKARYRRADFLEVLQNCGGNALGIVALISFMVGAILAFMGAIQLQQFGASIFVADLVAIGMAREMGAMMTAIIMAGRTGAAFAAQLGSMKVTQEIDALSTMGISPFEYLVTPRMIALILMMPLLCVFSDLIGMLGGAAVGVGMLDIPFKSYYMETISALSLPNFFGGLFKSSVYGALIATAGCLHGFKSGSSSSAVGDAATRAVVSAIVMIVVACGVFAVIFNVLHI